MNYMAYEYQTLPLLQEHNKAYFSGFESYSVGENEFNDMTNAEFVRSV